MKIEVRCTDCGHGWLVEEESLGGELLCSICLTRIELRRPQADSPAQPAAATTGGATAAAVAQSVAAAAPSARAEPAKPAPEQPSDASIGSSQIVCPRCKLHFSPRAPTKEEPVEPRKTVLVVEDLKYFREVASDALSVRYNVKTATSSREARAKLAEGGIDLMVLDLTLDGCEEGRRMLTELDPKPCPILIFTAQDESELYGDSWEELARLGADDLVIKGMNVGESLVRKVGNLLGTPLDDEDRLG